MVTVTQPGALLGWMGSLADPTRLRLLRLLDRHELQVAELCDALRLPQSTVSRHLKLLGDEGLVKSRPQATTRLYRMPTDGNGALRRLWLVAKEQTAGWPTLREDELRLARRLERRRPAADAFFAGAAARWDKLRRELYGQAFTGEALLCLLPRSWRVADLGCGSGDATALLAPHVGQVIGIDRSAAMLRAARRRTKGLPQVELRRGELTKLPLRSASVDGALLLLALSYVTDVALVLREMRRILKPGGRGVVVDLLRHDREEFRREMGQQSLGFEPEELRERLAEAGFVATSARALAPEAGAKGPALLLAAGERSRAKWMARTRKKR